LRDPREIILESNVALANLFEREIKDGSQKCTQTYSCYKFYFGHWL